MAEILTRNCNNKPVAKNRSPYKDYYVSEIRFRKLNQKGDNIDMKRTLNIALSVLSLAGIFAQPLQAGIATPSALFTIELKAGNNFISTPFARSEEDTGTIVSQLNTVLTVDSLTDTSYRTNEFQLVAGAEPYILEILDGPWIGYTTTIEQNTSTTITLPGNAPTNLQGCKYAIRKDWTVESLFGGADSSLLTGTDWFGGDEESADEIRLMSDTGSLGPVYLKGTIDGAGTLQWIDKAMQNVSKTRLPFGKGIFVKAKSDKTITLSGIVRGSRTRIDIVGGKKINLLANPVPFAVKLQDCGLELTRGSADSNADNLRLWNGTGWTSYWLDLGRVWRAGSNLTSDAGNTVIPAGAGFLVKRGSNRGDLKGENALKFAAFTVAP